MAAPMPFDAPVTTATLPASFPSIILCLLVFFRRDLVPRSIRWSRRRTVVRHAAACGSGKIRQHRGIPKSTGSLNKRSPEGRQLPAFQPAPGGATEKDGPDLLLVSLRLNAV